MPSATAATAPPDRLWTGSEPPADDPATAYDEGGLDRWSDARLLAAATAVVAVPKQAPADSFVLHAPLELLARARLLGHVPPDERRAARVAVVRVAAAYAAAGDPVDEPPPEPTPSGPEGAAALLLEALGAGDLAEVDRQAAALAARATADDLRRLLGPAVVPSLAAAGHAPILLELLPHVAGAVPGATALVRGPARELARQPGWRLSWFEEAVGEPAGTPEPGALVDALAGLPHLGVPGSAFIHPLMDQVETSSVAAEHLGPVLGAAASDPRAAARDLARVAAWSMLQEPDDHAPYGWTHCLTMPQAVMALLGAADARTLVAVAATHVAGFRTALAQRRLVAGSEPTGEPGDDLAEAIDAGPDRAAATAWAVAETEPQRVAGELAARAAGHPDAHHAKHTLACLDAAAADPEAERLHLAAAASLAGWWASRPS